MKRKRFDFDPVTTKMIGVTWHRDSVWKDRNGRKFRLSPEDVMKPVLWPFRWPLRWGYRRLPEPHLTYLQVELAVDKSHELLTALRRGPLRVMKGFIYSAGRVAMTLTMANVVLHWMRGAGFVFTEEKRGDIVFLDLDVEATRKNNIVAPKEESE